MIRFVLPICALAACATPFDEPVPSDPAEGEGEGDAREGEGDASEGEADASEGEGEGDSACTVTDVPGCEADGDDLACTLDHDGRARTFILHVPASMPPSNATLVFNFHGLNTTAGLQRWLSQTNDDSDVNGYVVVYPEGVDMSWNAGLCCGNAQSTGVDDVGFTLAILEHLRGPLCIDDDRVYSTGLSNGGHMSYRLACEHAETFAAIASVAGLEVVTDCAPSRAVPVLHFHGDADPIVNYDIGIDGQHGAVAVTDAWIERDACTTSSANEVGEVTCISHGGCAQDGHVELCTIHGGGHQWPGGESLPLLGHTTSDVSATQRISAFFASHPR